MEEKKRYTTMVFPQGFDGNKLLLNIVLIPRNQDPFTAYNTGLGGNNETAIPFAELVPSFEIKVVKGLSEWPIANASAPGREPVPVPVNVDQAANKQALLTAIAAQFGAKINSTTSAPALAETSKIEVNKYLSMSYRNAFNFTGPRVKNAKTDDSYECAVRKERKRDKNWKNSDDLSWGQVFAHILRQPMLAQACGMIYKTEVTITGANEELFKKGCYIYADIVNADYAGIQQELMLLQEGPFIKPYAARIPALLPGAANARPVFAPVLFPVLFRRTADGAVDPEPPKAPWDNIFAELNEYNDGFAKIVHAAQPVSTSLLKEEQDGHHPVKDEGIRLAWDDEQILIWYMRQLQEYKENPADPAPGVRIDAPLGVYGYRVDVKEDEDAAVYTSLNRVSYTQEYTIGDVSLGNTAGDEIELPFQVFPSQLDNDITAPYWLPMYFTGWTGKSIVLKDTDAVRIHQNDETDEVNEDGTPKKVEASNMYAEVPAAVTLRYGNRYRFRVRMMDISGGGPAINEDVFNNAPSPFSKWSFKRYIAPGLCRIDKPAALSDAKIDFYNETIDAGESTFNANPVVNIQRPTLGYPAVVFTGKYTNPVQSLIDSVEQQKLAAAPGSKVQIHPAIADPDVTFIQIKIEVETLRLDNLASDSGKENYITLYNTTRKFPGGFDDVLSLPIQFNDYPVLNLGSNDDPFNDPDLTISDIHEMNAIPLPTARRIRMTIRGVCGDAEPSNESYYGFINEKNTDLDSRYGKTTQLLFYKESGTEQNLLLPKPNVPEIQALYLQPDPEYVKKGVPGQYFFFSAETSKQPDIMQRLAQQLGLRVKGLTLVAEKGERVVFGCSSKIRHHLAPDGSSITFSTKADLCNHWLGCITYNLNRDWSWDALEDVSFTFGRTKKFKRDSDAETEVRDNIGDIEIKHSASFESLLPDQFGNINRNATTLIFIDAIEPKTALKKPASEELRFPDELEVSYSMTARLKKGHGSETKKEPAPLKLPTTVNPAQVPKISSVGIAFSKYIMGDKYSYTEPRQKYLWIELEEPVKDPHDTLFCRVLHYAPDQMISNNHHFQEIEKLTEEPPQLPIDPEYIRIITPNQTDDMAGLGAMQAMEKASGDDDLHYLLPLPPGLHAESAELFGFFTYEFRIGHGHWSNKNEQENVWSTAQGRFGRALTVTGMQHPAPTLLCMPDRDDTKVYVTAPYAKAVWEGKNVTCDPPRTQLHAVLYAQVKQADNEAYRNILIDTKLMNLVRPPKLSATIPTGSIFAETAVTTVLKASELWSVKKTDEIARAQVILSNLTLMDEVKKIQVDEANEKKLAKAITEYRKGKTVKLDLNMARNVVTAFEKIKATQIAAPAISTAAYTDATLLTGQLIAAHKDYPKTAEVSWTNKEIAAMLEHLGLPEDAPLSVIVVEVFGNITSILEHLTYVTDDVLQKVTEPDTAKQLADLLLERRRKNREALTNELGNYRILRTSPLTAVPFVCCATC